MIISTLCGTFPDEFKAPHIGHPLKGSILGLLKVVWSNTFHEEFLVVDSEGSFTDPRDDVRQSTLVDGVKHDMQLYGEDEVMNIGLIWRLNHFVVLCFHVFVFARFCVCVFLVETCLSTRKVTTKKTRFVNGNETVMVCINITRLNLDATG